MSDLKPFEIKKFGGLNYREDPLEVGWGGAVSGQDFTLEDPGIVRTRNGTTLFADLNCDSYQGPVPYSSVLGTTLYLTGFCKNTSTKTTTLKYVTTGGSVSSAGGAWTGSTEAPKITGITRHADAVNSALVFASYDDSTPIRLKYWSGSGSVTDLSVSLKPRYVAATPNSNRLAAACYAVASDSPTGANGSVSTVFFSSPSNSSVWGSNDYVALSPGDGEVITGMAVYRDFLFVFKQTKFFVFYGETVGPDGSTPEFNFRTVPIPVGAIQKEGTITAKRVCAGHDGVYFVAGTRVYKTDGGQPLWVNEQIEPSAAYGTAVDLTAVGPEMQLTTDGETLYVLREGQWIKRGRVGFAVEFNGGWYARPLTGGAASDHVLVVDSSIRTDEIAGVDEPIVCDYVTGKQPVSPAGAEGVIREVLFEGTGLFDATLETDGTTNISGAVTATEASMGRYRKSCRGRYFKLYVESSAATDTAGWSLSSVYANVLPGRPVGAS